MANQGIIAQVGPIRASEHPGIFTTAIGKGTFLNGILERIRYKPPFGYLSSPLEAHF